MHPLHEKIITTVTTSTELFHIFASQFTSLPENAVHFSTHDLGLHEKETEDGYSEELSTLRETIDELKSQLKGARAQATESSCIVQVKDV